MQLLGLNDLVFHAIQIQSSGLEMPNLKMLWNPTLEAMLPAKVHYIESGRRVKEERLGRILKCGGKKVYLNSYIISIVHYVVEKSSWF